uniref:3'-5' exonuclease n=1 Tax=Lachnospira sp. TaxID=2049031 RepID=UPI003FEDE961
MRNNQVRIIKDMKSYRVGDGRIHIREASSQPAQADIVISLINKYVKNGGKLSDAAILYRVKKEAAVLVSTLETIGMPFYTRDLVDDVHLGMCYKDMLAYYRLSRGIPEDGDLVRIINRPKRYIRSNLIKNCGFDRNKIYEACTANAQRHECLRINDTINDMFLDFRSLSRIDNPTQFLYYIYNNMGYEES